MALQTIKEGVMYKRGRINTDWRQRLFVLNGKQLAYFKGGRHAPSGIIEIKDIRTVTTMAEDGSFQVILPTRTYDIRGDTKQIGQEWIAAIRAAKDSPSA
eukprot:Em0019g807a